MSRGSKAKHQSPKREPFPELSQKEIDDAEALALAMEVDDEMFGPEDAEYFRLAGIDDKGNR